MEDELVIILPGVIMILAVIGYFVNGVVQKVLDYKRDQNGLRGKQYTSQVSEIGERTEMIEDRLRVLERIATDRGQLLSDEIDALRSSIPHEEVKERS